MRSFEFNELLPEISRAMFLACRRLTYGWVPRFTLLNSAPNVSYKNSKTPALYIFNQLQYYKKLLLQFRSLFLPCFKLISSCVFILSSPVLVKRRGSIKKMGKGSKSGKAEEVGKGKVSPVQVAFIVDRYLSNKNYSKTLSLFRSEASLLISQANGRQVFFNW